MKNTVTPPTQQESFRLRELILEIGLPLIRLREVLEQSSEECLAWWSNQNHDLNIDHKPFGRFSKMVSIDENQLFMGTYDRKLARKRIAGDMTSLPERYLENQNSFVRTSDHILRYVVLTRGQHFADQVLYKLNVSPLLYDNLDTKINLTYFADLLETLQRNGFTQDEMDTLASVMFLSLQDTPLGNRFKSSENFFDIYETLSKNYNQFDSNFEYQSRFVGKKYYLKTRLPMDQHSELQESPEKIQRLMRYRHILSAWFPFLAGMSPVFPKVEFQKRSGIIEVEYEFDLEAASKPPKRPHVV